MRHILLTSSNFTREDLRTISERMLAETTRAAVEAALTPGAPLETGQVLSVVVRTAIQAADLPREETAETLETVLRDLGFQARVMRGL